jgi:hypothetical protein
MDNIFLSEEKVFLPVKKAQSTLKPSLIEKLGYQRVCGLLFLNPQANEYNPTSTKLGLSLAKLAKFYKDSKS